MGASRVDQVEANVAALDRPRFSDEELAAIEDCLAPRARQESVPRSALA